MPNPSGDHYLKRELEERLTTDPVMWHFLQQGSLDGVWYWDLERDDNEWMSPEFWRLFGIDPATKRHDPAEWQDLIFPEDLAVALENFERHCADPAHPYDQIVRYRHANGSTVWVRCRGMAIRDETGKAIRMLGAHNNVTPLKLAEEEARTQGAAAVAAIDELRGFANSLSRDLKTPATTLQLMARILRRTLGGSEGSAEVREVMEMAIDAASRLHLLVDDLVDYTSVFARADDVAETVEMGALAAEVSAGMKTDLSHAGARLEIGDLPAVSGNRAQLRTLLEHLLSNALKFHRSGVAPDIAVTGTAALDGRVGIVVSDNGIGVPDEDKALIFRAFSREHLDDSIPGAGLGLAICRRVALNHGGDIRIESTVGEGAAFIVDLPAAAP